MSTSSRGRSGSVKRFSEPLHTVCAAGAPAVNPGTLARVARHRTTIRELAEYTGLSPGRRELRAARHAGLGRDRAAGARGGGGARLRGRSDRPRAGRRRDRRRRPARRQPQRLLEPGARARRPARALRRRPQHARRRRRRRARARARAGRSGWSTSASTGWSSCRSARRAAAGRRSRGRCATVTIGDALPGVAPAGEVVFDNERGVQQSLQHLSALGHRRVTVLSWAVERSPDRQAERAVAGSAAALGIDCRVVPCAYSLNGSRPLALELLAGADRPTAVLCLSDSIAYGVYAACAELGLSIPGDVAVAGFGDHPISRLLSPPLTSTVWDVDRSRSGHRVPARRRSPPTARRRRCARSSRRCSSRARRREPDPAAQSLVEVRDRLSHRPLGRFPYDGAIEHAPPIRPGLVLDDDPVRKAAVVLVEMALVAGGGGPVLLARVLDQPVGVDSQRASCRARPGARASGGRRARGRPVAASACPGRR